MPYPQKGTRTSIDGPQRRSYGQNMPEEGAQQMGYGPDTPDPQEQRPPGRASAPDSSSSQVCTFMPYPLEESAYILLSQQDWMGTSAPVCITVDYYCI